MLARRRYRDIKGTFIHHLSHGQKGGVDHAARIITWVLWICELCKLEPQESSHVGMCMDDSNIRIWALTRCTNKNTKRGYPPLQW
ncbi:hypothetical protein MKX03_032371 [Papaver bracteatum]|nr:hypothetical protein MKX03_032371 [Papaver bracteatum]